MTEFVKSDRQLTVSSEKETPVREGSPVNRGSIRHARKLGLALPDFFMARAVLKANQRRLDPVKRARLIATATAVEKLTEKSDEV